MSMTPARTGLGVRAAKNRVASPAISHNRQTIAVPTSWSQLLPSLDTDGLMDVTP